MGKWKHTPGPWTAEKAGFEDGYMWNIFAHEAAPYHKLPAECWGPDAEENARLIAAAPDLLAALKEVMTMLEPIEQYMSVAWADIMKHCRSAIAKAEGLEVEHE